MASTKTKANTASVDTPAGKLVRLNVNLNQETADALKKIASESRISYTEAVRRAISVYKFVDDEIDSGHKVQTVDSKGSVRELVLM